MAQMVFRLFQQQRVQAPFGFVLLQREVALDEALLSRDAGLRCRPEKTLCFLQMFLCYGGRVKMLLGGVGGNAHPIDQYT